MTKPVRTSLFILLMGWIIADGWPCTLSHSYSHPTTLRIFDHLIEEDSSED